MYVLINFFVILNFEHSKLICFPENLFRDSKIRFVTLAFNPLLFLFLTKLLKILNKVVVLHFVAFPFPYQASQNIEQGCRPTFCF